MTRTADAVVVGAGIVGAATAHHLAARGLHVVVADRTGPAAGATGRSAGFVRVYQDDPALAALSAAGLAAFPEDLLRRTGCVYPVASPEAVDLDVLRLAGPDATVLDAAGLRAAYPAVTWPDDAYAVWEPDAGWADPVAATRTFLAPAELLTGAVTGLLPGGGVRTSAGDVAAPVVVVATGAWAARTPLLPGAALPVRSRRIVWQRARSLPGTGLPCYVEERPHRLYFRADAAGGARFGAGCDEWDVDPDALPPVDAALLRRGRVRVAARLGAAVPEDAEVLDGYDAYLPDGRPVVGAWPGTDGVYVALAFAGGGFKTAPAVGRALAALVVDGLVDPVLAPFAPEVRLAAVGS